MVDADDSCQFSADWQPKSTSWLGLKVGGHPALSLHSSDEPGEVLQWLWSWWQHHRPPKHCHGYHYYYYWSPVAKRDTEQNLLKRFSDAFVNNQIKKGLLLSLFLRIFLIGEYLAVSSKKTWLCLVHFLRLLAVCWPGRQSARDSHALACNFAEYSDRFFKKSHTAINLS